MDNACLRVRRTLTADPRFHEVNLDDDQVWDLNFESGEPPAAAVQTTFGLRCNGMRIFPRFTCQGITLSDPRTFSSRSNILAHYVNYALATFHPFPQLNVEMDYWVPNSQCLNGRIKISNEKNEPMNLRLEMVAQLNPQANGASMEAVQFGVNTILKGSSGNLFPVLFITGGPEISTRAFPALEINMTLAGGSFRKLYWCIASLDSVQSSFTMARQMTALPWENEILKIEMETRRKSFLFSSKDKTDWADLLNETEIKANQLLVNSQPPSKRIALLVKRDPDTSHTKSLVRGDAWSLLTGISVYDIWTLSRILLPTQPETFKDIIESVIDLQQPDGAIPWAFSESGTPSRALTPPLFAGIACDVFTLDEDLIWLKQVYSPLLRAFQCWFTRKRTDLPVWESPVQTNLLGADFELNSDLTRNEVDLRYTLSPSLLAMLFHECKSLERIALWLNDTNDLPWITQCVMKIKESTISAWDSKSSCYVYQDIETRESPCQEFFHEFQQNRVYKTKRNFKIKRRFCFTLKGEQKGFHSIQIKIVGSDGEGKIEESLLINTFSNFDKINRTLSSRTYFKLESIEISGLHRGESIEMDLAGFESSDISLLLPLWAGIPSPEQAKCLVDRTLFPRYLTAKGLSNFPVDSRPEMENRITPFWNSIMVEGLLSYGYKEEAAKVAGSYYDAVFTQWQESGSTNSSLRLSDGRGMGEMDSLAGLPQITPLLKTLGVEKISEKEVILNGLNHFLPAITVQYGKVIINLDNQCTVVGTINGNRFETKQSDFQKVLLP